MYDTIEMQIKSQIQPYHLEEIESALYRPKITTDEVTGQKEIRGFLVGCDGKDYKIYGNDEYLRIYGRSIVKWLYGENLSSITRSETQKAFKLMSDMLSMDICKANVTRFDIGANIPMINPVGVYLKRMGTLRGNMPKQWKDSLYYGIDTDNEIMMYDKLVEVKKERERIPQIWQGCNVLRIEQRYKHPKRAFGYDVSCSDLISPPFYKTIIDRFTKNLKSIKMIKNEIDLEMAFGESVKGLNDFAIMALIERFGGLDRVLSAIDEYFYNKPDKAKIKHDLRTRFIKCASSGKFAPVDDEVVKEIESVIENINPYYE